MGATAAVSASMIGAGGYEGGDGAALLFGLVVVLVVLSPLWFVD